MENILEAQIQINKTIQWNINEGLVLNRQYIEPKSQISKQYHSSPKIFICLLLFVLTFLNLKITITPPIHFFDFTVILYKNHAPKKNQPFMRAIHYPKKPRFEKQAHTKSNFSPLQAAALWVKSILMKSA